MIILLNVDEHIPTTVVMHAHVVARKNENSDTYQILKNRFDGRLEKEITLKEVLELRY